MSSSLGTERRPRSTRPVVFPVARNGAPFRLWTTDALSAGDDVWSPADAASASVPGREDALEGEDIVQPQIGVPDVDGRVAAGCPDRHRLAYAGAGNIDPDGHGRYPGPNPRRGSQTSPRCSRTADRHWSACPCGYVAASECSAALSARRRLLDLAGCLKGRGPCPRRSGRGYEGRGGRRSTRRLRRRSCRQARTPRRSGKWTGADLDRTHNPGGRSCRRTRLWKRDMEKS